MDDVIADIQRWQSEGKRVALATVISAYGSAPRKTNAKMAVSEDGEFVGSVSGGCVENDVVEHARQVIEEGQARLVPYGIADELAFTVGLACGGKIDVFVQPLTDALLTEAPAVVAYVIQGSQIGAQLVVTEDGDRLGTLGYGDDSDEEVATAALGLLREGRSARGTYVSPSAETFEVFFDVRQLQPEVVIFGGVHIGVALARLARLMDYRVVVVDARNAWVSDARFPEVDEVHTMHADDYLASHPLGSNDFVAVLSHDPKLDDPALIGALVSRARYVGAVGSKKTQGERRQRLLAAGLTDEQVNRLHGPIGLDINAQTPEEIAVSILGEMIQAKNALPSARSRTAAPARA